MADGVEVSLAEPTPAHLLFTRSAYFRIIVYPAYVIQMMPDRSRESEREHCQDSPRNKGTIYV